MLYSFDIYNRQQHPRFAFIKHRGNCMESSGKCMVWSEAYLYKQAGDLSLREM